MISSKIRSVKNLRALSPSVLLKERTFKLFLYLNYYYLFFVKNNRLCNFVISKTFKCISVKLQCKGKKYFTLFSSVFK